MPILSPPDKNTSPSYQAYKAYRAMGRERSRQLKVASMVSIAALAFGYGAYAIIGANALNGSRSPDPGTNQANVAASSVLHSRACAKSMDIQKEGTIKDSRLNRISGLAASRLKANTYWVHNDAGDSARIFSIRRDGSLAGTFNLAGIKATDWEDIDIGPGPIDGKPYLYIADTGDSQLNRKSVTIYRIPEPNPDVNGGTVNVTGVETLNLVYPDGAHDVEAVFIDQLTGEIYAVDKTDQRVAYVYHLPGKLANNSTTLFTKVSTVGARIGGSYQKITGADMAPDNAAFVLRTNDRVLVASHQADTSIANSMAASNICLVPAYEESRGEAVGFYADSKGLVTVSEGSNQPIYTIEPQ